MAKLGLLFPFQEMLDIADEVIKEEHIDIAYRKVVTAANAVNEARKAIDMGADIIISRGYVASLIKKNTNVPLVEMRIHAQEIGLLIKKAKNMLVKEPLHIGIICYRNMLSDMSNMAELFDVDLTVEYMESIEESFRCVSNLKKQGIDCIIGGQIVCNDANSLGMPALIYGSSAESMKEAFREAQKMTFAMEAEKRNEAQFETLLDTTFNGIIKINAEENIIVINKLVENLIGMNLEDVVGKKLVDVFPEFDESMVKAILQGKSDNYTVSVNIRKQAWILLMAPIQYNEQITGAILSLQKLSENIRRNSNSQKNMYLNGYVADSLFKNIHTENETMQKQIELARKYALSDSPLLICAEEGMEYYELAEAIHNSSARKNAPFVSVDMNEVDTEEQMEVLFGKQGEEENQFTRNALLKAQYGTLFIKEVEKCTYKVQSYLVRMLRTNNMSRTDILLLDTYNVRLIFSTKHELKGLVEKGEFNEELYYMLRGLVLHIPPARERKEDLQKIFKEQFAKNCKKYNKYLVLTNGAEERIQKLEWRGNWIQIAAFCERLVLSTDRRSIDEVRIQKIYDELYPECDMSEDGKKIIVYREKEADEIERLLEKYHGSRNAVAKELGISTTTLWRKMKKYGIERI